MRRKAIVVGAGVFGASIADELARRRWRVDLVEQYQPGNARQSSGGETRLIRYSHGGADSYSLLAWRARELWQALERDVGEQLFIQSGVMWFAHREDGWESESAATLARVGIPARRLEPDMLSTFFPSIETRDLAFALHEPQAGVLRARRAVRALVRRGISRGVELIAAAATPDGKRVTVGGQAKDADVVVWACGPWLPRLFPDVVRAEVTQQDVVYFGADGAWETPRVPGWVDYDRSMYGTGDVEGLGFKCAADADGPAFDPEQADRSPLTASVGAARRYLAHRFPALGEAPIVSTRVCQYTSTPDAEWIVAPHPEHESVWLAGGGSGHGFKHGPALGEYVADVVANDAALDPRFGLGPRPRTRGLRTSGDLGAATPVNPEGAQ